LILASLTDLGLRAVTAWETGMIGAGLWKFATRLVPPKLRHEVGCRIAEYGIADAPDRLYFTQGLIPQIGRRGGRTLYIGCRWYTASYPGLIEQHGSKCATVDVDPRMQRFGAKKHVVCDICDVERYFLSRTFDSIVLSGLFGFGLDTFEKQDDAVAACLGVLKPDGLIVIGWNRDRAAPPDDLPEVNRWLQPMVVDGHTRKSFAHSTHVFSYYAPVPTFSLQAYVTERQDSTGGSMKC